MFLTLIYLQLVWTKCAPHALIGEQELPICQGTNTQGYPSLPSTYFDDALAKLVCKWFRQIVPLSIRYTILPGINHIPILQPPSFYIPGAPGPKPQAAPQLVARAAETALGVSFNAQSQAPDIPEFSARATRIEYTLSLNTTQNDPDISTDPLQPLCIPTTCHIHPFLPQIVSQGHTHLPPSLIQKTPY